MDYLETPTVETGNKFTANVQPLTVFVDQEITYMGKKSRIRPMYYAAFSCLLLALAMGLATGYSSPAIYDMTHRHDSLVKPTKSEQTWIGSMLALGAMIGGLVGGPLADKLGRKETLIFNIVPFGVGWLLICYAPKVLYIMIGRFICGFACGVVSVAVPMYCVEISTAEVRGILGSAFQGFIVIGSLLSAVIGLYVHWGYLAAIGAAVATAGVICFLPMPKSPRWLLAKDKLEEAIFAMNKLQGGHADAEKECTDIHKDLQDQPKGRLSFRECKHPTVYKPAAIAFILMFFQQFSGSNAVLFYSAKIFEVAEEFMNPKQATVILCVFQVIATLISNIIVDKTGRKILLILSGIFMALSLIVLGTFYYMSLADKAFQSQYSWLPLVSLILFVNAFSIGYGSIPWLLTAEMVPVRARSTVGGLATFANGLFAFIVTKTFSEFEDLIGSHGTFWFYSGISLIGVVYVIIVVPETKGKELEEIEKLFHKSKSKEIDRTISISYIA